MHEDGSSLEQQLARKGEEEEEAAAALPRDIRCAALRFRVSDKGAQTRGRSCPHRHEAKPSASLQRPQARARRNGAVRCTDVLFPWMLRARASSLSHGSGPGQKVGYIHHQTRNSSSHPSTLGWPLWHPSRAKPRATPTESPSAANAMLFSTCVTHPCALTTASQAALTTASQAVFSSQHLAFSLANTTFPLPSPSPSIWWNCLFCKSHCKC